jgi:DNA-binding NarL/FixJ family response regulator
VKTITVITLDDHHLVRQGIRSLLDVETDIKLVGEGSAGEHLEPLMIKHRPDVVLLDLGMPQQEDSPAEDSFRAMPAIAHISNSYPDTKIIIVSQYVSKAIFESAMELGVGGYLLKDDALSMSLVDAVRAVHRDGFYFSKAIGRRIANGWKKATQGAILTPRQLEIIQALADNPGLSYAQHAEKLGISEHTFNNHLRKIYEKLEATTVLEALVRAVRLGIVLIE